MLSARKEFCDPTTVIESFVTKASTVLPQTVPTEIQFTVITICHTSFVFEFQTLPDVASTSVASHFRIKPVYLITMISK